jgi:centromeric protein E
MKWLKILREHDAGVHVLYTDSKLRRILQPSRGGNARTVMICNVNPAAVHTVKSNRALRFGCHAKRVRNHPALNEVMSDAAVLTRQAKEIHELRRVLASSGCG